MNGTKVLLLTGLLMSTHVVADYDTYGLLFTNPDQRSRLDKRFETNGIEASAQTGSEHADGQAAASQPLRLNGTLVSSVGRKQVWINGRGQMTTGVNQTAQVRLLNLHKVEVKAAASGVTHTLKPGQILDPSTGHVSEAYERVSRP